MAQTYKPKITKGRKRPPDRMLVYGPEGTGKTNFARQFPDPLFIDWDHSTDHLDVARIGDKDEPPPQTFAHLRDFLELLRTDSSYRGHSKTLVFETLDHVERAIIWPETCRRWKPEGNKPKPQQIDDIGFQKGYPAALNVWHELLEQLSLLQAQTGMSIILNAHSTVKTMTNLGGSDFSTYEPALHTGKNANAAELVRGWAETVLFFGIEDFSFKEEKDADNKKKVGKGRSQGEHYIITRHTGWCMAKNRVGLPEKLAYPFETDTDTVAYDLYTGYVEEFYSGKWLLREMSVEDITQKIGDLGEQVCAWGEKAAQWYNSAIKPRVEAAADNADALKSIYAELADRIKKTAEKQRQAPQPATSGNGPVATLPPDSTETKAAEVKTPAQA